MHDTADRIALHTDQETFGAAQNSASQAEGPRTAMSATTAERMNEVLEMPSLTANTGERAAQLAMMAATLLQAEKCMIMLLKSRVGNGVRFQSYSCACPRNTAACRKLGDEAEAAARKVIIVGKSVLIDRPKASSAADFGKRGSGPAYNLIASPVRIDSNIVGVINLIDRQDTRRFCADDIALLEIVAGLIGQSLHVLHLECLLGSQFAQMAVAREAVPTLGNAPSLGSQGPQQLARILAKSFYREMVKVGLDPGQIVDAASEIISQLSSSLKKHSDRLHRIDKGTRNLM